MTQWKWAIVKDERGEHIVHVYPADEEHDYTGDCHCKPEWQISDEGSAWVHREESRENA